jgi:hypothetical protein
MSRIHLLFVVVAILAFGSLRLGAQETSTSLSVAQTPAVGLGLENPEPTSQNSGPQIVHFLSSLEFWLSVIVIVFGVFVVTLEYRLLARTKTNPSDIMRVLAVTLILVGSLFLITAGYSSNQISPVSGLFGTVAGYLLGRTQRKSRKKASTPLDVHKPQPIPSSSKISSAPSNSVSTTTNSDYPRSELT